MHSTSTKLAAAVTLVALGAGAAITLRPASQPATLTAQAQQPVVRVETRVIHRTVRVVKHIKPPNPPAGGQPTAGPAPAAANLPTGPGVPTSPSQITTPGPASTKTAAAPSPVPLRTKSSGAAATSKPATSSGPVRTRTSGSGRGGERRDD